MKSVLPLAALISLIPLTGTARAGDALPTLEEYARTHPPGKPDQTGHHKWFMVSYADGKCEPSPSPQEVYNTVSSPLGHMTGLILDRIAPDDVFKDGGDIQVLVHGKKDGEPMFMNFFTVKATCDNFVETRGIKPAQANSSDIN
jgi:hypothetical protein